MTIQFFRLFFVPVLGISLLVSATSAMARQPHLDAWRLKYPNSTSDDLGCQLCHEKVNGGEPWNAYGWDLRMEWLSNGNSIGAALDTVEFDDHDNDPINAHSFDEIIRNFQPGWTEGPVNTLYMSDGTTTTNQPPPPVLPSSTAIDFPPAVSNPIVETINTGAVSLQVIVVAESFVTPVKAVRAPGINGSLFVVEKAGKIVRVDLASGSKTTFADVSADLVAAASTKFDERGLLGLAFHPNYQNNGLFYTYQSEPLRAGQDSQVNYPIAANSGGRSMIVEYRAANPSCNSPIIKQDNLLVIDQPQANHNGGDLLFDTNGNLYISLGDGGGRDDQGAGHTLLGNSRDNTNPLGSILRIDPLGNNSANGKYGIPADNPFIAAGDNGVDEIYAYGLRNPYRMSLDALNGDLYAADVGQDKIEEVDIIVNGGNYGWNWMEGSFGFYDPDSTGLPFVSNILPPGRPNDLIAPIAEYDRSDGSSITGGYVYRGAEISAAIGSYMFGDLGGRLFYLDAAEQIKEFSMTVPLAGLITGFGQDSNNELYVVSFDNSGSTGKLWRMIAPATAPTFPSGQGESPICPPDEDMCFSIIAANGNAAVVCL